MENRLEGKVALVTGAASGIGKATSIGLADEGAFVAALDMNTEGVDDIAQQIEKKGGRSMTVQFDLSETDKIPGVVKSVIEKFQRIDILINCAAHRGKHQPLGKVDGELWDLTFRINVTAPMLLIQEVVPHMIDRGEGGRIVNISSGAAFVAGYASAYSCSKSALNQLTRSAAGRFGRHGIRVNTVAPGLVDTPGIETISNIEEAVKRGSPMANLLEKVTYAEDVSGMIVFLCLPESRMVTGQTIHVNAGSLV